MIMKAQSFYVDDFVASMIDGETIVPASHPDFFPTFGSGSVDETCAVSGGPSYFPFGVGYILVIEIIVLCVETSCFLTT